MVEKRREKWRFQCGKCIEAAVVRKEMSLCLEATGRDPEILSCRGCSPTTAER